MPRPSLNPLERKTYKGKKIPIFCLNVQKRRLELGLSQTELAEELGIPRPRLSELESGRFPKDEARIIALAHALKVDINWLFGFTPEHGTD